MLKRLFRKLGAGASLLIDDRPQLVCSTRSMSIDLLVNNSVDLAKAAKVFRATTIVTTITARAFAGLLLLLLQAVAAIDRTVWHDKRVAQATKATGRTKIMMAGPWTDNSTMLPTLSAMAEGFEVDVVINASGDYDLASHERAVHRLVEAGAVPITWLPVMLERQADGAHSIAADAVSRIMRDQAAPLSAGA